MRYDQGQNGRTSGVLMGYIERNLIAGERVVYKTRTHWWLWASSLLATALLVVGLQPAIPVILDLSRRYLPTFDVTAETTTYLTYGVLFLAVMGGLNSLAKLLQWLTDEIGVTTLRIISKRGWIVRSVTEVALTKFEACELSESLLGRLLGYKTLIVTGTGGTSHRFTMVRHARTLRDHILAQAANGQPAVGTRQASLRAAPSQSVLDDVFTQTAPIDQIKRAAHLVQNGDRQAAAELVKHLAAHYPEDADVWYLVGLLQTDRDKQRNAYQKALTLNPNHRLAQTALRRLDA